MAGRGVWARNSSSPSLPAGSASKQGSSAEELTASDNGLGIPAVPSAFSSELLVILRKSFEGLIASTKHCSLSRRLQDSRGGICKGAMCGLSCLHGGRATPLANTSLLHYWKSIHINLKETFCSQQLLLLKLPYL